MISFEDKQNPFLNFYDEKSNDPFPDIKCEEIQVNPSMQLSVQSSSMMSFLKRKSELGFQVDGFESRQQQPKKQRKVRSTPRVWNLVAENFNREECAPYMKCHRWKEPVTNAPKGAGCRVSQCVLHAGCTHLIKMRLTSNDVVDLYTIEEHGQHSTEVVNSTQGLNDIILDEVDALLLRGMTPSDALTALQQRYTAEGNWTLLSLLPSDASKIRNRMFTLAKKASTVSCTKSLSSIDSHESSYGSLVTTNATNSTVTANPAATATASSNTLSSLTAAVAGGTALRRRSDPSMLVDFTAETVTPL